MINFLIRATSLTILQGMVVVVEGEVVREEVCIPYII